MTRIRNQRNMAIAMILMFVLLIVEACLYARTESEEIETKQISIIVYGTDSERWENLKNGAELACERNIAEVSVITMSSENDPEEQKSLIDREIENGADALIVAACDSKEIGDFLDEKNYRVPIIFAET